MDQFLGPNELSKSYTETGPTTTSFAVLITLLFWGSYLKLPVIQQFAG